MKLRFSIAHFSVWQRSPFRNNFMPSLRQSRQTGPMYLAIHLTFHPFDKGAVYSSLSLRPAYATARPGDFTHSHSTFFRRPAAVMRNPRPILDRTHRDARGG